MPSSADDDEREIAQLREEVRVATSDADAARVLAAGADRDVADVRAVLRAHTTALSALRETQMEQGQKLDRLEQKLDEHVRSTAKGFSTLHTGMAHITALLTGMIESE